MVDGREMTVAEIAGRLGITKKALQVRRSRLGGASYQTIVNMYRENAIGSDGCYRYMVDGRWMTTGQIADMLGVKAHTISSWRYQTKGSMADAIAWFRQLQTGERKRYPGRGGCPPKKYRVRGRDYTVPGVAEKYGVSRQSVHQCLARRGGDMGAVLRFYQDKAKKKQRRAEDELMRILGY
jgi:uncharacterized protein YjcR